MNENLKQTLEKQIELIKKKQNIRQGNYDKQELKEKENIEKTKKYLQDLSNQIDILKQKINDIERKKLNENEEILLEDEYNKNVKILENNELIKFNKIEIDELKNDIIIIKKLYKKKLEHHKDKQNIEIANLEEIKKEKNNQKKLIITKFERIKKDKTLKYENLLNQKEELENEIKDLKEKHFYNKEQNLIIRNKNIKTIINFKKTKLDLKKHDSEYKKNIQHKNRELEYFEEHIFPIEKEKILLYLKNKLIENDNKFNSNIINQEQYFNNSKKINEEFDNKYNDLLGKFKKLKLNQKKINNEYQKFKIYENIKFNNFNNQIERSNNYFGIIKEKKNLLNKVYKNLNEYNIISNNIEEIKNEELENIDREYIIKFDLQNSKYLEIIKEKEYIETEQNNKINNINEKITNIEKKIDYLDFTNNNLNLNHELKIKNYLYQEEFNSKNLEKFKIELQNKQNLYEYKNNLLENLEDIYNNNKLKKEIEINQLLIEELFQIQEIRKKIDEFQ